MNYARQVLLVAPLFLSFSSFAGKLIEKYPHTSEYTLQSGRVVKLPLRIEKLQGISILGTVDCHQAQKRIDVAGLYPIKLSDKKCLSILYALKYIDGSLGPYKEVITLLGVTTNPNDNRFKNLLGFGLTFSPKLKDFFSHKFDQAGVFFHKISLDSQYAVDAGIEIWGIPKLLEKDLVVDIFDWGRNIKVKSHEYSFEFNKNFYLPFLRNMKLDSWTPTSPHTVTTRFQTLLSGTMTIGPIFNKSQFQFGTDLTQMQFNPLLWLQIWSHTDAVFFKEDVPL